jgi:hypothetical protein
MANEYDSAYPIDHTLVSDYPSETRAVKATAFTVGMASAFEGTVTPANRPNTATALANNALDRGRLWLDDNFDPPILKRWDGSAWEIVQSRSNSLQTVNVQKATTVTCSTAIPLDDTIPQNTEGDEVMTLAITPTSTTNELKITVVVYGLSASLSMVAALFQDTTANALATGVLVGTIGSPFCTSFVYYMTAGTTSSTTFKVRCGDSTGDCTFNMAFWGDTLYSSITIEEIKVN